MAGTKKALAMLSKKVKPHDPFAPHSIPGLLRVFLEVNSQYSRDRPGSLAYHWGWFPQRHLFRSTIGSSITTDISTLSQPTLAASQKAQANTHQISAPRACSSAFRRSHRPPPRLPLRQCSRTHRSRPPARLQCWPLRHRHRNARRWRIQCDVDLRKCLKIAVGRDEPPGRPRE